jgi:PD-(D/E)XK nuclease superfamily
VAAVPPRTLAEALAGATEPPLAAGAIDDLRARLDASAAAAAAVGGWHDADPLRLAKASVTWLLACPRRAVAGDDAGAAAGGGEDLAAGLVVDAAAKVATLVPHRPPTVDAALAFLAAGDDERAAGHLASLDEPGRRAFLADLRARVGRLAAAWPPIEPAWWPRVEEPVRARMGDGGVVVSGRIDVLLGGPPTGRPAVLVEVKAGRWYDGMRADGHLYALLVALRDGAAPAAAVTVVADGTTQVEPIRPSLLAHAAERVEEAMAVAARLAAGEPPAAHPGPGCPHCPARPDCLPGQAWRPDPAGAVPA